MDPRVTTERPIDKAIRFVARDERKERTMSDKGNQGEWPTSDELAEAYALGCMVCGAPGSSLEAEGEIIGKQAGSINPVTGEVVWDDTKLERMTQKIYCSECGEVIWEK